MSAETTSLLFALAILVGAFLVLLFIESPPPGFFMIVLTVVAALITFLGRNLSPRERAAWSVTILALAVFEFYASQKERKRHESALEAQMKVGQATMERLAEFKATLAASVAAQQRVGAMVSHGGETNDLRKRASELSDEILRFLLERQAVEPVGPRSGTWQEDTERLISHLRETMALYSHRYGARVIAVRNELARRGLTDRELDMYYEHPTNPLGVRAVGERLGALALRLR